MPEAPASTSASRSPGSCVCGQVVFDLSGRTVGAELTCSWCGKRYYFMGGQAIQLVVPGQPPPKPPAPAVSPASAAARAKTVRTRINRDPHGPPGGLMPMIGFIVGSNVVAIVAVTQLFQKSNKDDLRHFIFDESFTVAPKAIWPEIVALLLGMVLGFGAWALFAYRIHKRELAAKKSGATP